MIDLNLYVDKDCVSIEFSRTLEPEQLEKALEILYTVTDEYLSNIEHDFNETVN